MKEDKNYAMESYQVAKEQFEEQIKLQKNNQHLRVIEDPKTVGDSSCKVSNVINAHQSSDTSKSVNCSESRKIDKGPENHDVDFHVDSGANCDEQHLVNNNDDGVNTQNTNEIDCSSELADSLKDINNCGTEINNTKQNDNDVQKVKRSRRKPLSVVNKKNRKLAGKDRPYVWSIKSTLYLIQIYGNHREELNNTYLRKQFWDNVETDMNRQNFIVTKAQCINKWKKLMQCYRSVNDETSGRSPEKFYFYDAINRILSTKPAMCSPHSTSSVTPDNSIQNVVSNVDEIVEVEIHEGKTPIAKKTRKKSSRYDIFEQSNKKLKLEEKKLMLKEKKLLIEERKCVIYEKLLQMPTDKLQEILKTIKTWK